MFVTLSGNVVAAYRASLQHSRVAADYASQSATTWSGDTCINHLGHNFSSTMTYEVDCGLYNCILLGLDFFKKLRTAGVPDSVFESLPFYQLETGGGNAGSSQGELANLQFIPIADNCSFLASSSDTQSHLYSYNSISIDDVNIEHSPGNNEVAELSQYVGVEGFHYLEDILLRNYTTGARLTPFSDDISEFQRTLAIHGLNSDGLMIDDCRYIYMFHIMLGDCVEDRVCHGDRTACCVLRNGFSSPRDFSFHAFHILANSAATSRSTDSLMTILRWLRIRTTFTPSYLRRQIQRKLVDLSGSFTPRSNLVPNANILYHYERSSRAYLIMIAHVHRIYVDRFTSSRDELKDVILAHFLEGDCFKHASSIKNDECVKQKAKLQPEPTSDKVFCLKWLQNHIHDFQDATLLRVFNILGIQRRESDVNLKGVLTRWIRSQISSHVQPSDQITESRWRDIRANWPITTSQQYKDTLVQKFRENTSREKLVTRVCASCSECTLQSECYYVAGCDIDFRCFLTPDRRPKFWKQDNNSVDVADPNWLDYNAERSILQSAIPSLPDVLLDKNGVVETGPGVYHLWLCKNCHTAEKSNKVPSLSLANHNYLGQVPTELSDLTILEEVLIAKARAKKIIFHLKDESESSKGPSTQKTMKGHTIIYPQRTSNIITVLPPPKEEVYESICILFVGSSKPDPKWVREKAKPLIVRRQKVLHALCWLRDHNPLYADVRIDSNALNALPENDALDVHVEYVTPTKSSESLTSRYDGNDNTMDIDTSDSPIISFPTVVIADVNPSATATDLRRVAANHFKNKRPFLEVRHGVQPVNEFCNPTLFPSIYPTLFPYGIGGFEQQHRSVPLSFQTQCRHLCNLSDTRFQTHPAFMFTAFNTIQRRAMLLHISLKVKRSSYDRIAQTYADISSDAMHRVAERMSRGETISECTTEERSAYNLLKEVNVVTSHVPGSSASKVAMRNEIRAMILEKGLPTFYLTINPSDTHNPLVRFISGEDINIDDLGSAEPFSQWAQSILIANNPVVGATFFHKYITNFIDTILKYEPGNCNSAGGALGVVKSYYGCVEAQGRGSLHCHMLIWIEGALNVDEIKDRVKNKGDHEFGDSLLKYLDDTISSRIPVEKTPGYSSTVHPCAHRGPALSNCEVTNDIDRQNDLHLLAEKTQRHLHSDTCFKYWKGPLSGEPRLCRFDLDSENTIPESYFDEETGDIHLRKLDGLVNNFNDTILRAIRCNMDIKFIGSGPSAKAVIYYITDYITKSQLKTHVAYAALDIAIQKLGDYEPDESTLVQRAKRLLQRCAYTMIKHQELSAQQVASYVLGLPDHFKSHACQNFFWTSFEHYIDSEIHSNECYQSLSLQPGGNEYPQQATPYEIDPSLPSSSASDDVEPPATSNDCEEVVLDVSDSSEVASRASRIQDYILRSSALGNVCLWDYTAQFFKVKGKPKDQSTEQVLDNIEHIITSTALRNQPTFGYLSNHPDALTHHCKLKAALQRNHPNPLGPSLPRRDTNTANDKHSRLMLIFFKPWRTVKDLICDYTCWTDAYDAFIRDAAPRVVTIINNIQLLHDCKDSRDDHFASRRYRQRAEAPSTDGADNPDNSLNDSELAVLEHLAESSSCQSHHKTNSEIEAEACINAASQVGMFDSGSHCDVSDFCEPLYTGTDISGQKPVLEQIWKSEYESRNQQSRAHDDDTVIAPAEVSVETEIDDFRITENDYNTPMQDDVTANTDIHVANYTGTECNVTTIDADVIAREFSLNDAQKLAYDIVVKHSSQHSSDPEQLKMYISGPGGTGKSQVINALKSYFDAKQEGQRFKLASYTGIAAKNINGITLHSALMLNRRKRSGMTEKSKKELISFWEKVDYLFIDEVSMIGCKFMYKISEALCDAKQSDAPFGGINIIFAGDFAQLPPVADPKLYSSLALNNVGINKGIETVLGKLLWYSVRTIVCLTQVMRQSMTRNANFISLLSRLRLGCCTDDDYTLLQTRIISNINQQETNVHWNRVPVVVSKNECKDAMNIEAVLSFAKRTNAPVHWYYSRDKWSSNSVTNPDLQDYLWDMPSNKTNQRLGKLPLVIGMPVMITTNFDVSNGIVNGSTGTLADVRYTVDSNDRRHAVSCVIESTDASDVCMHSLPERHVVAIEDTTKVQVHHPYSQRKCTISRTQLPILPAFAMTVHKAQGQSMDTVMGDIESVGVWLTRLKRGRRGPTASFDARPV